MNYERNNKNKILRLPRRTKEIAIMMLALGLLVPMLLTSKLLSLKVYAAEPREAILSVKQTFESGGEITPPEEVFTYRLVPETPKAPMPVGSDLEGYTFTIVGTKEAEIGPLLFNKTEVYTYTLSCTTIPKPGFNIDKQTYKIEIYVSKDGEEITIICKSDDNKVSEMAFRHSFGILPSDPSNMMDPPVQKTVRGNPSTASTFSFILVAGNPSYPMPKGSENGVKVLTIIGAGEAEFGTWSYTQAGTYTYTISEIDTKVPGYTYDETIYTITDVVTVENGRLVVARTVRNNTDNKEVSALSFVNRYTSVQAPGSPNNPSQRPGSPGSPGTGPKTGDFNNLTKGIVIFGLNLIILVFIIQVIRLQYKVCNPYHKRQGNDA